MNETMPAGYRMTELGPLPEEWQVVRLGEVVSLQTGIISPADFPDARYVGLEHLDSGEIFIQRYGIASETKSAKAVFQQGDILYGKLRPYLDKAAVAEWEGVCSTDILVLRGKPKGIDTYFLAYLMHSIHILSHAIATTTGVNHPRTSWKALSQAVIPLPPLAEQRAIAHVLRTVQEAKEATERVIQATRELKKSLMRHLFTYGPVPVDEVEKVPLKETEIGPVPEHWEVVRLGEVVEKVNQVDPRKNPKWRFGYIDVSSVDNQQLRIVRYQEYLGQDAPSRARKPVRTGDVIFATVRPYLKRVALVPSEFDGQICSTAFCVLRADNCSITPKYLFFAVSHDRFVCSVSEHQRGSSYPAVTDGDVLRELIPLPPLPEQHEIARILEAVDKKLQAEEARKQALEALFKTLLHNLMTGKIRVNNISLPETTEVK